LWAAHQALNAATERSHIALVGTPRVRRLFAAREFASALERLDQLRAGVAEAGN
jgi:hypothetical protein